MLGSDSSHALTLFVRASSCNDQDMRRRVLVALAVILLLGIAVGGWWYSQRSEEATWAASGGDFTESTTRFTALVTQSSCNGGKTNAPRAPQIQLQSDRIVVTFTVESTDSPFGSGHTCPGNPAVPVDVVLPEPIGNRPLVDGTCPSYDAAAATGCTRVAAP